MRDEPAVAGCSGGLEWRVRVVGWHVETVRVVRSCCWFESSRLLCIRRFGVARFTVVASESLVRSRLFEFADL